MKFVLKTLIFLSSFIFLILCFPKSAFALADGSSWTEAGTNALPVGLYAPYAATFNNKMWVFGGFNTSFAVSRKVYYSSDGFTWTEAGTNALPVASYSGASVVYDSKIWIIGGVNGSFATVRRVYSSSDGTTWAEVGTNSFPVATSNLSAVVFDNKMWVIGGRDSSNNMIRKVYWSTDGITWTEAGTNVLPVGTMNHTALVYNNKMWVIGGYTDNLGSVFTPKVYSSTDGTTWTEAGTNSLPVATAQHTSVVYDNKMWVIGGTTGSAVRKVYSSTDGITWTEAGTNALPVATSNHSSAVFDNKMWVFAGENGGTYFRKVYYVSDSTPPTLSSISPSAGTTINGPTPTITFTTDEIATCRVSVTDQAYADMSSTNVCTGSGSTSHSCLSPNLGSNGSRTVYIACTDNYGNAASASTNTELTYTLNAPDPSPSSSVESYQIPFESEVRMSRFAINPIRDSILNGQNVTVIIEPMIFRFNAFLSSQAVLSGPVLKSFYASRFRLVGYIQNIWYKSYPPNDNYSPAKIIPELQNKPSILSLSFANLPISGLNPKKFKLVRSLDGKTWSVLPNSVVDTVNKTVSAVTKIGGYYAISQSGGSLFKTVSTNNSKTTPAPSVTDPQLQTPPPVATGTPTPAQSKKCYLWNFVCF
ncbi:MAG: hypothetical protein HYV90_04090 [Candidatus Woesebacteria bacterium]|nr:MAG: hypothetical protein HYV90_04090 [Candidatus Woesebacteria bacterium]